MESWGVSVWDEEVGQNGIRQTAGKRHRRCLGGRRVARGLWHILTTRQNMCHQEDHVSQFFFSHFKNRVAVSGCLWP